MAKIVCEFDTKEKTLVVKQDGNVMDDVTSAYFDNFAGKFSASVYQKKENDDGTTVFMTTIADAKGVKEKEDFNLTEAMSNKIKNKKC